MARIVLTPRFVAKDLCDLKIKKKKLWTEKSLKTEGSMILSIDIFYFKTVIIGGPTNRNMAIALMRLINPY